VFLGITGAPWLNTLYFAAPGDQSGADQAVAATGAFWGAVDNFMNSAVTWSTQPEVAYIDPVSGDTTGVLQTAVQSGTGSLAIDVLPPATQAVCRLRTGVFIGGREIRGRIYIPGLTEAGSTAGNVTAATATSIQTALTTLLAAPRQPVIWSRKNGQDRVIVAASVWNQFGVLRSRRD